MGWEDPDIISDFLIEAEEHLDEADAALLELEGRPADPELRRRLNGCFHTLKGMASYVDFKEVELLCHATESLIGSLPHGSAAVARRNVDIAFQVVTLMRQHFAAVSESLDDDDSMPSAEPMRRMYARISGIVSNVATG